MELHVFNFDTFERLGVIDTYQEAIFKTNYRAHSELELVVDATANNIDWLITMSDDVFLTTGVVTQRGYMIENFRYIDESQTQIIAYLKSLSFLTSFRHIERQTNYNGKAEIIMRQFVNDNAISPSNANRRIANLKLGKLNNLGTSTTISYNGNQLDDALWDIAVKQDITFDILADIPNKQFLFSVWQGVDRSSEQSAVDPVIFAKEFDNILSQDFEDDSSLWKNTAYVAGAGEGTARKIIAVGDINKGRHRREIYVDARDIQDTEEQTITIIGIGENPMDPSDNTTETTTETVPMSAARYEALLIERGNNKLGEYERVQAFKTAIDFNSQFKFREDYEHGDKVTIRNDEINVAMHTRVVVTKETYDAKGYALEIEFGSEVPNVFKKIKKVVK